MYGKTALGCYRDKAMQTFMDSTAASRVRAFYAFLICERPAPAKKRFFFWRSRLERRQSSFGVGMSFFAITIVIVCVARFPDWLGIAVSSIVVVVVFHSQRDIRLVLESAKPIFKGPKDAAPRGIAPRAASPGPTSSPIAREIARRVSF